MPTKPVSWTQQPVVLADIIYLHFDRGASAGSFVAEARYEVRDETSAVRFVKSISQPVAAWPANLSAILTAINTAEGT
jgi:hypothetical protein